MPTFADFLKDILAAFLEAAGPESRNAEVARHWALVPESFYDHAEQLALWVRAAQGTRGARAGARGAKAPGPTNNGPASEALLNPCPA